MDIVEAVNSHAGKLGSLSAAPPGQLAAAQAPKVAEETGEPARAVIGPLAANPRKGRSHAWPDVDADAEACGVVGAALVLSARRGEDPGRCREEQLGRLTRRPLARESAA
ncbi:hypothetical protein [Kitasatospora sp. NPDC088783]|uniref:hypothetical protein n=1 Tax=Kitasatospora sp. NPDC088783 TaxID=3364077 RepID=UPI003807CA9D